MSRSLKYDSNFFFDHGHIYIYMDTTVDHFTPLTLRVRGKYIHLYPDNQNSRWVVDQWCPRSFCSLSKDDTRASRYHGVCMYSINADDFHSPSVLRRDRSHPILLLISHGQVNSTECLNPKNLCKMLPNA